jgi:hypothetical protein
MVNGGLVISPVRHGRRGPGGGGKPPAAPWRSSSPLLVMTTYYSGTTTARDQAPGYMWACGCPPNLPSRRNASFAGIWFKARLGEMRCLARTSVCWTRWPERWDEMRHARSVPSPSSSRCQAAATAGSSFPWERKAKAPPEEERHLRSTVRPLGGIWILNEWASERGVSGTLSSVASFLCILLSALPFLANLSPLRPSARCTAHPGLPRMIWSDRIGSAFVLRPFFLCLPILALHTQYIYMLPALAPLCLALTVTGCCCWGHQFLVELDLLY